MVLLCKIPTYGKIIFYKLEYIYKKIPMLILCNKYY
jgi:hypothetical protein